MLPYAVVRTVTMSKVQLTPQQAMKAKWGIRWGCHNPATLSPWKRNGTFAQEAGWAQDLYGRVQKMSPPPEFDPRTIQPVASHQDNGINFRSIKVQEFYSWHKASCCVHEELFLSRQQFKMTNFIRQVMTYTNYYKLHFLFTGMNSQTYNVVHTIYQLHQIY